MHTNQVIAQLPVPYVTVSDDQVLSIFFLLNVSHLCTFFSSLLPALTAEPLSLSLDA